MSVGWCYYACTDYEAAQLRDNLRSREVNYASLRALEYPFSDSIFISFFIHEARTSCSRDIRENLANYLSSSPSQQQGLKVRNLRGGVETLALSFSRRRMK